MSTQSLARANAEPVSEEDYQALLALLSATARGRAFLQEHARRARHADTGLLLEAVARIEAQIAAQPSRADLLAEFAALSESVRAMRSQIDTVQLTEAVTKLAATLDGVQQRLTGASPAEPAPAARAPQAKPDPEPKAVQAPFALALTAVAAQALAAAEPDEEPVKVFKAGSIPPPPPFAGEDFGGADLEVAAPVDEAASASPGADPMQQIMALTEEERLALFS